MVLSIEFSLVTLHTLQYARYLPLQPRRSSMEAIAISAMWVMTELVYQKYPLARWQSFPEEGQLAVESDRMSFYV